MFFKKKEKVLPKKEIEFFTLTPIYYRKIEAGEYRILSKKREGNFLEIEGCKPGICIGDILNLHTIDDPGLSNRALDYRNSPYKVRAINYSDESENHGFSASVEFISTMEDVIAWNRYKKANNL